MADWIAYWNGRFVPDGEVTISPHDRGFTLGDAAYEVTRTYRHKPFHLDWHLDRLYASLAYLELHPGLSRDRMVELTHAVLDRNRSRLAPDDDVLLTHRVTRGLAGPIFRGSRPGPPTVLITCKPVPFAQFAQLYGEGVELETPRVRQSASGGIDPRVKTHSRLVFALGAAQVAREDRSVLPLLVDVNGCITETAFTNVFFVFQGRLETPPEEMVLGGITRKVVIELARELGSHVECRRICLEETLEATEAFVTSTSAGLLPVCSINGRHLTPVPGPVTQQLRNAFSRYAGVDIVAQSRVQAGRPEVTGPAGQSLLAQGG